MNCNRGDIMNERMNKGELEKLISTLKIEKGEYWILSSASLVLRGIYDSAADLDLAVTEKGLKQLKENYNLVQKENGWYIVNDKVECVLDTKEPYKIEKFGEYYLQDIYDYYNFIKNSNREKDKKRIPLIENYINTRKKTNLIVFFITLMYFFVHITLYLLYHNVH